MAPLDDAGQQLFATLQQHQQNPGIGIPQVRALADAGDRRARCMAGYLTMQQGQIIEALPYVRAAAADGAMYLAGWLVQNLAGQTDPTLRAELPEMVRLAARTPFGFDPYQGALTAVQQGDPQAMQDILDAAYDTPPWSAEIDSIVRSGRQQLLELQSAAGTVAQERDAALAAFPALLDEARRELAGLREVAAEAGALASDTSAEVQAKEYGDRAEISEARASRFTRASIGLAIAIASASVVIAVLSVSNADKIENGLQKAAFAIPFLVLNGYLIGLAREARREALRWRHVQLQLRATVPFLGVLDDERRKDVTALLALRFFPGQPLPEGAGDGSERAEVDASALAALLTEGRRAVAQPQRIDGGSA